MIKDNIKYQEVYLDNQNYNKENIKMELMYNTSDNNKCLHGVVLNIHYDPKLLKPTSIEDNTKNTIYLNTLNNIVDGDNNMKIVKIAWLDININWPGRELPTIIAYITFELVIDPIDMKLPIETTIQFSESEAPPSYDFKRSSHKLLIN